MQFLFFFHIFLVIPRGYPLVLYTESSLNRLWNHQLRSGMCALVDPLPFYGMPFALRGSMCFKLEWSCSIVQNIIVDVYSTQEQCFLYCRIGFLCDFCQTGFVGRIWQGRVVPPYYLPTI
jgi:hypothetical protein